MATAPTLQRSRMVLHERGTWSAREDRIPSAVWLGILWVGMIAGLSTDIPDVARRNPPAPTVLWVHGAVFTVWMLLLTAQVLLVLRDRVAWHRKLGWSRYPTSGFAPTSLLRLRRRAQLVGATPSSASIRQFVRGRTSCFA